MLCIDDVHNSFLRFSDGFISCVCNVQLEPGSIQDISRFPSSPGVPCFADLKLPESVVLAPSTEPEVKAQSTIDKSTYLCFHKTLARTIS